MPVRILVTTTPFGTVDPRPLELLRGTGWEVSFNELGRPLREDEMLERVGSCNGIIAGTEPITARVLAAAPRLKVIARAGVGLDSVDLAACRQRGIAVSYAPEAGAPAVAELTIGLMLDALRGISATDRLVHGGGWRRTMGRRLSRCTVGVVGVGRIGKRVVAHVAAFGSRILGHDIAPDRAFGERHGVEWVDKNELLSRSDVVTLHVPLTALTRGFVGAAELALMPPDAVLINTARGAVVSAPALVEALREGRLGAVALDVFEREPYTGELTSFPNVVVTCHMGSCSRDCRARMELEATAECIRVLRGERQASAVPDEEYAPAARP